MLLVGHNRREVIIQIRKDLLEKLIELAGVSVEYLNSKDEDIKWITVKGNHIPIKKGQTEDEAVKAFLSKVESKEHKPKKKVEFEKQIQQVSSGKEFSDLLDKAKMNNIAKMYQIIDHNSQGQLNADAIKEELAKAGNYYIKTEIDIKDLAIQDEHKVLSENKERNIELKDEETPIIVGQDGFIIDGRHRTLKAKELGKKTIHAYVPAETYYKINKDKVN